MRKIGVALNKDLKEIYDYDPYKSRLWQDEFEFVDTDNSSGERFCVRLKIKEMFDESICRIYKF